MRRVASAPWPLHADARRARGRPTKRLTHALLLMYALCFFLCCAQLSFPRRRFVGFGRRRHDGRIRSVLGVLVAHSKHGVATTTASE
jgi:hypothetical protein